jgi:transcriptional regulator with XRE-family HTH domain
VDKRLRKVAARRRIAENLRRHRRRLGISQEALAEGCGLHRTYIGSIERCERNVSIDNIERIALALGLDVVDLLAIPKRD